MKVLELFAGSRSFSRVAEEYGWETYTTDIEPFEKIDQVCDIVDFDINKMLKEFGKPDVIWASPMCKSFSVASIGHHWKGGAKAYIPKTIDAVIGMRLVAEAKMILRTLNPRWFYIENPRGLLRKLPVMTKENYIRHTIWYCQYHSKDDEARGLMKRAKPTDIWTNDEIWTPRDMCKNGNPDCDHEKAPRGARTGTQGLKGNYERSMIPADLCREIIESIIKEIN